MHERFPGPCISTILQARAEQTPEAPAILAPARAPLTYRRFYQQMVTVVLHMQAMGLGHRDRIALVLPNGPQMAVAALSVAAGAICAPLNPAYRAREFEFYLKALRPQALIVQQGVASPVRAVARARGVRVIELVETDDGVAGGFALSGAESVGAAAPAFTAPDDVALVLHTSGTTSRAKVVPLTQANICTAASHLGAALRLTRHDRCLNMLPLFHTYGLVAATLTSLVAGASTVCLSGFEASQFFASLADDQPTWYQAVPAMHQAILAQAALDRDRVSRCRLRFIRSGSTPLPPAVRGELERTFNAPVIEGYGMVEASGPVTCNPPPSGPYKPGSIGASIGPEVAIVDAHGTPLKAGRSGEIVVRGATVMQGYENDALANAQAFRQGWFRSGDAGYMDAEGYVFLTGRLKEMINRGGEKVVPQEVDDVLLEHPAVAQALTFALPHAHLGEAIAAAVVLHPHAPATASAIRRFAATRLAAYKVPQQVFIVPDLPKDPTGLKPQRHAVAASLGALTGPPSNASQAAARAVPHASLAAVVARIWADVLQVEYVGPHDNFFALGGHSLLALQVLSRLQQALHIHLSPWVLFDGPTVAEMVRYIETGHQAERHVPFAFPKQASRPADIPVTAAQAQIWLFDQIFLDASFFTLPYLLRLTGMLHVAALQQSFNEIIRRHEALRTTFRIVDGQLVQTIAPMSDADLAEARFDLRVEDLSGMPPWEREALAQRRIQDEIRRPFDLAQGPLLRGYLIRFGPQDHRLLITLHHMVSDGWSLGVLARELATLYDAFAAGEPSPLAALPMQSADYALWQRQWQRSRGRDVEADYWKNQLRGLKALPLPSDRPRDGRLSLSTAREAFTLSSPLCEALTRRSQEVGSTLFMALMAACNLLLCRYTSQADIHVGTLVANRNHEETEAVIGLLSNTVILRTQLDGNPSYREVLRRVRETTLAAYAHQELPFNELALILEREMGLQPTDLCQVMLILQHATLRPVELPSRLLHIAEMDERFTVSHFPPMTSDLVLVLREIPRGLVGSCIYKTSLFNRETIQHLLQNFQTILDMMATRPDTSISALDISK